ncbi:hypothetical protein LTR36_005842 [Oleoguttula mirabilis]|uniref:Uncharacterized protein n=1 Tax=Oleoguttula mirabilis TaxID=1507867 RepID=A0AAV9JE25_9PEZI|nr:hypothetical protein LTR36_005842 [Oleoguttula mirabilis]
MAALPVQIPLSVQGWTKVWTPDKAYLPRPTRTLYFLNPRDLVQASRHGFHSASDVYQAYLQGAASETYTISLVCIKPHHAGWMQGNAASLAALWNEKPQKFAPTPEAAQAFKMNGDANNLIDIPLVMLENTALGPSLPFTDTNVEQRTRSPTVPQDLTSFVASQAHWSENTPPPVAAILEPLRDHDSVVSLLKNRANSIVNGPNGRALRDFAHILPARICTDISKDGTSSLGGFSAADQQRVVNKIRMSQGRWRGANNTLSTRQMAMQTRTDETGIRGLSRWQLRHNTSWERYQSGRFMKLPGSPVDDTTVWYGLPYLHPTSPLLPGNTSPGRYSARITRALFVPPTPPFALPPTQPPTVHQTSLNAAESDPRSSDDHLAGEPAHSSYDSTPDATGMSSSPLSTSGGGAAGISSATAGVDAAYQYPCPSRVSLQQQNSGGQPYYL